MKTKKPMYIVIAGLIACAFCAAPLLLPMTVGIMGASIVGFSLSHILFGVLAISFAIIGIAAFIVRRKPVKTTQTRK